MSSGSGASGQRGLWTGFKQGSRLRGDCERPGVAPSWKMERWGQSEAGDVLSSVAGTWRAEKRRWEEGDEGREPAARGDLDLCHRLVGKGGAGISPSRDRGRIGCGWHWGLRGAQWARRAVANLEVPWDVWALSSSQLGVGGGFIFVLSHDYN